MTGRQLIKGFRFGMLLQLAIGPLCLLVFQSATEGGFFAGFVVVLAVTLIDSLYIALSCLGAATLLKGKRIQWLARVAGCLVLVLFGVKTLTESLGLSLLPSVSLFSGTSAPSLFLQGLLLTASNPLTILFWSGLFTARQINEHWNRPQLAAFAVGCVSSTLFFLSSVALAGSLFNRFLPDWTVRVLNGLVGAGLIVFGIRMLLGKSGRTENKDG